MRSLWDDSETNSATIMVDAPEIISFSVIGRHLASANWAAIIVTRRMRVVFMILPNVKATDDRRLESGWNCGCGA